MSLGYSQNSQPAALSQMAPSPASEEHSASSKSQQNTQPDKEEKTSVSPGNIIGTGSSLEPKRRQGLLISTINENEPLVTRRELWSYYLYYNGDNGVGPLGFSMVLFQALANAAGYDPTQGPGSKCTSSGPCVLPWLGGTKSVSSIVLIANGVSFGVMTFIFTTIGSAADYGNFGRWFFLVITLICWGSQFASMTLTVPSRWPVAMALFMVGFITYGATLVFYSAVFPRLARNTPQCRKIRELYERGEISVEEYEVEESLEKNRISNISTVGSQECVDRKALWATFLAVRSRTSRRVRNRWSKNETLETWVLDCWRGQSVASVAEYSPNAVL